MRVIFTIPGRFPSLNDYIGAMNAGRHAGNDLKQRETERCAWEAKQAGLRPVSGAVRITICWIEKDQRRDLDNISSFGCKVLLDGLREAGVLPNDTRRYVRGIYSDFPDPDPIRPRVEVTIETIDTGA